MQAVILGAGGGTRIRPLSASVPTPMFPVADRSLVANTAGAAAGVTGPVFAGGRQADAIGSGSEYVGVPVECAEIGVDASSDPGKWLSADATGPPGRRVARDR